MERLCGSCHAIDLNGVRTHEMSCKDFEEGTSIKRDSLFEQSVNDLNAYDFARYSHLTKKKVECDFCKKLFTYHNLAEWDTFQGKTTALCFKCYGIYEAGDPLNGI